jgi:hypothetical protein
VLDHTRTQDRVIAGCGFRHELLRRAGSVNGDLARAPWHDRLSGRWMPQSTVVPISASQSQLSGVLAMNGKPVNGSVNEEQQRPWRARRLCRCVHLASARSVIIAASLRMSST